MDARRHRPLANLLVGLLVLVGITDVWAVIAALHRASLVSGFDYADPQSISLSDARAADHQVRVSAVVGLLVIAVTAIVFITWLYELSRTVHERRPGVSRLGSGWAIGGWFVPFLNVVRPYQVVADVWRSSAESLQDREDPPKWIVLWWVIYLIHNIVGYVVLLSSPNFTDGVDTQSRLVHFDRLSASAHGLSIVAAVFAIMVVRATTPRVDAIEPSLMARVAFGPPAGMVFTPAPGWPAAPLGWTPQPGWQPDPAWPPAPANWQFWRPSGG